MATFKIPIPWSRNFTAALNTSQCFSGSDAGQVDLVEVGGEYISNAKVRGWRQKIARGQQATGTFSGSIIDYDVSPGYAYTRKWCNHVSSKRWATEEIIGYHIRPLGVLAVPNAPTTSIDSLTNALALARFASKAREAQGSFRGSTAVAELADTLRGIRNPARGIRDLIDSYHARARRNAKKALGRDPLSSRVRDLSKSQARDVGKALSETWLEYAFGIMPLIGDVKDASRSLDRYAKREPRVPIKAFEERLDGPVISFTTSTQSQNFNVRGEIHNTTRYQVHYYGAVKLATTKPKSLAQESGFAVRDFVPALWEWIPYSFLVDYFTNIGDILEAASVSRSDVAWAGRTWRNIAERTCVRSTVTPKTNAVWPDSGAIDFKKWTPSSITWRRKYFSRAAYNGSLVPRLVVEIPGFRNSKKWLNIAALAYLRGMAR